MMKYILIFLSLISLSLNAQSILKFNKKFIECEDRWVAFQMDKDSTYSFGFIYIDSQAGLTFNLEGDFKIDLSGHFSPHKIDTASFKYRLEPNNVLVAFIPEEKFNELQIKKIPDWLKYYKTDTASIERLFKWGYMYNGWEQCGKALTYLEKAYKINPDYNGLEVEMAFSYNCMGQYQKALKVLENALKKSPKDAYVNKELIFAQVKSGQLKKAAKSCRRAMKICNDNSYNGENCYNLLHAYYEAMDKENFYLWLKETKKWISGNEEAMRSIEIMENNMNEIK